MRKHYQLTIALLTTLPILAGCHGMQGPDKSATVTPSGTYGKGYNPQGDNGSNFITPAEPITNPGLTDNSPPSHGDILPGNIDWSHPPAELVLVTVHFDYDQYNIRPDDRKLLEAAAKTLAADPTIHVVAVGHCDWHGSEQYNLALGERRSNSAKGYLSKNGAAAAQIETLSFGAYGATPDVGKQSPEAKNDRRVDVVKIPAGATLPSGPPADATAPADAAAAPADGATPAAATKPAGGEGS
jgi:peptidoglycan-associated lipoprotein